jgi:hypothetical protein
MLKVSVYHGEKVEISIFVHRNNYFNVRPFPIHVNSACSFNVLRCGKFLSFFQACFFNISAKPTWSFIVVVPKVFRKCTESISQFCCGDALKTEYPFHRTEWRHNRSL